jgi:hypothetical protein
MNRREKPRRRCRKDTSSSDSSNYSSGSSSESVEVFIKQKVHKKREKSSSSDSSSTASHKEKCKKKECSNSSSDRKNKCKKKKQDCSFSEKKSDCEKKEKCSFDEIYKCYKQKLLDDPTLMIAGSTAYINATDDDSDILAEGQLVDFANVNVSYNIDHAYEGSPFYVRDNGTYLVAFIINTEQGAQFCVYVNGLEVPLTRYGINSGAGQLFLSGLLNLNKNDGVLVRNSFSSVTTVQSLVGAGGIQNGNPTTFLLYKLSPTNPAQPEKWDDECISKRKLCLFKKIKDKLLCDKELMVQGYNVHGGFYNTNAQSVILEADVVFDTQLNVNGLQWNLLNPSQIVIQEDGVYKLIYLANVDLSTQLAITVNGVPVQESIQGVNKGSAQLSGRLLVNLKKNDVLTLRNHTSAVGTVTFTQNAGGVLPSISVLLDIVKISNISKPVPYVCKPNKHCAKYYCKLKNYLLNQCDLQLTGTSVFISSVSDSTQEIVAGAPIDWNINVYTGLNVLHDQGTPSFTILENGIYVVFVDTIVRTPSQFTIFVNGVPDLTTTSGRSSGGGKELMRQLMKLSKGDVLTVNNYQSNVGTLVTSDNAGGQYPGISMHILLYKLSPQ